MTLMIMVAMTALDMDLMVVEVIICVLLLLPLVYLSMRCIPHPFVQPASQPTSHSLIK